MTDVSKRLKASKTRYVDSEKSLGRDLGIRWASARATYQDLRALAGICDPAEAKEAVCKVLKIGKAQDNDDDDDDDDEFDDDLSRSIAAIRTPSAIFAMGFVLGVTALWLKVESQVD